MSRNVFSPKRAEPIIAGWSGQTVIRESWRFARSRGEYLAGGSHLQDGVR
jgi:hypothetical protein